MAELDPFQGEVARLALEAARQHGFALAGSNALAVHGIISRPTEDIDLFTDGRDVQEAANHIAASLMDAGFTVEAVREAEDLSDVIEGFSQDMAEYDVSRAGHTVRLQLVRFGRNHSPVQMDIGPVLHLDDLLGSKVAALASRAELRDYLDVAEALRRYPREHLITLAHRADPDLDDAEFADAMQYLDRLDDSMFTELQGLTSSQVQEIRKAFSGWPR